MGALEIGALDEREISEPLLGRPLHMMRNHTCLSAGVIPPMHWYTNAIHHWCKSSKSGFNARQGEGHQHMMHACSQTWQQNNNWLRRNAAKTMLARARACHA